MPPAAGNFKPWEQKKKKWLNPYHVLKLTSEKNIKKQMFVSDVKAACFLFVDG